MCLSAFVSALGSHEMGRHKLPMIYFIYLYLPGTDPMIISCTNYPPQERKLSCTNYPLQERKLCRHMIASSLSDREL